MPRLPKKVSGAEHARKKGLVTLAALVTPDERALIQAVHGLDDVGSVAAFVRRAAVGRALELARKHAPEKIPENLRSDVDSAE